MAAEGLSNEIFLKIYQKMYLQNKRVKTNNGLCSHDDVIRQSSV